MGWEPDNTKEGKQHNISPSADKWWNDNGLCSGQWFSAGLWYFQTKNHGCGEDIRIDPKAVSLCPQMFVAWKQCKNETVLNLGR